MQAQRQKVTFNRVIDGDTIEITQGRGFFRQPQKHRIRLYGIDAPESSQKGGPQSTKFLTQLIGTSKKIWLNSVKTDQYGRTVGLIYKRKRQPHKSYNIQMVQGGHAHAYMLEGDDKVVYETAEAEAKGRRRGMWRQAEITNPWDYRRAQRVKDERKNNAANFVAIAIALALVGLAIFILFKNSG